MKCSNTGKKWKSRCKRYWNNKRILSFQKSLQASKEKVALKDSRTDDSKTEEETVLLDGESRESSPYVVQEIEPQIEGIVVVCSGGDHPAIQREIIGAISALFPVESHKIKVMKSKEAK